MNTSRPKSTLRRLGPVALGLLALELPVRSAPFEYAPGDLLLAFRQSGSASDLIIHAGKAATYSGLPSGQSIVVTNVAAGRLGGTFPSLGGLEWFGAAANRPPLVEAFPLQTLWLTAPRRSPETPAPAWVRKGQFVQGNAASQVDAVGRNAAYFSSLTPAGPDNATTVVAIPVGSPYALDPVLGDGTFVGTFQGRVPATLPDDFEADPANTARIDLYELQPGTTAAGTLNAPGRFLGYFELKPDGRVTFNTLTPPPPAPVISGIRREGDVATVTFTSANGATYRLRSTGAAGLGTPINTWTAGATVTATGTSASLSDTTADSVRFYAIEIQP